MRWRGCAPGPADGGGVRLRALIGAIHPRLAVVLHDLVMVWAAWMLALLARRELWPDAPPLAWIPPELPVVLLAQGTVLWWTGLYRGLWRFASLPDLVNIARACLLGAFAVALALFLFNRLEGVPRSVLVLYPPILAVLLGLPRLAYRYWKDSRFDLALDAPSKRVLILGAGRAAEALLRELRQDPRYRVVGLLDDDPKLRGAKIHGFPVLGGIERLGAIAAGTAAEMLLIAIPSATNKEMQRIVEACEETGLPFRTVPRLQDVVTGRLRFVDLKEVAIEDLLGREPVSLDWTSIRLALAGRHLLVTGGGGSIGGELCRQLARLGPASLTVLEHGEYNLYRIEQELRRDFPELVLHPLLGDVCEEQVCRRALARGRAEIVFHAAAYKHVPLLEGQLRAALRNNLLGTAQMALACAAAGVRSFVLISTDKAVNPTSVMGASKRAAERLLAALAREDAQTRFITVRFGNVLDSAGSVVPLFREQIARGGPVTVTHPEIERYFMTIPEACQLILQAAVIGQGGEIFALDMGEPVKIRYLAEQMIRLAGKVPGKDIPIVYTGLRPGEKLCEELFHEDEAMRPTAHPKILQCRPDAAPPDWRRLLAETRRALALHDEIRLERLLGEWVPEYHRERAAGEMRPNLRLVAKD